MIKNNILNRILSISLAVMLGLSSFSMEAFAAPVMQEETDDGETSEDVLTDVEENEPETDEDITEHTLTYTDNEDGTHTAICTDTDCDYSITEEHVYTDGVCVCEAEEAISETESTELAKSLDEITELGENSEFDEDELEEHPTGYIETDSNYAPPVSDTYRGEIPELGAMSSRYVPGQALLPSLRSQMPYGSCWAHAAIGLAELNMMKKGYSEPNYSEAHLAYFSYNTVTDSLGGLAGDRNSTTQDEFADGGDMDFAGYVLANWIGAADESVVPYKNIPTYQVSGISSSLAYKDAAYLTGKYNVNVINDRDAVKWLVQNKGGVAISFWIQTSISRAVSEKIYNKTQNCAYDPTDRGETNHGVVIVGWDDNYSKNNFAQTPAGDGAWLVRNSWATGSYADNQSYYGYFWLSYYDKTIAAAGTSYEMVDAGKYDNNYQYDGSFCSTYLSRNKVANVFTAKANANGERIEAVAFSVNSADLSYTISIYTGLTSGNNPESGTLEYVQSGQTGLSGYYTVDLNSAVNVDYGEKYSVVIQFMGKNTASVEGEASFNYGWCNCVASAKAGQSFYYNDSSRAWEDYGAKTNRNLRIKAFTTNINDENYIVPISISFSGDIDQNEMSLSVSEEKTVFPVISPRTATNKNVTWSSSNTSVATVSSNGVVKGISAGTAVITAKTQAGSAAASFTVTVKDGISSLDISWNNNSGYAYAGERYTFSVTRKPANCNTIGRPVWSSSNSTICSIDAVTGEADFLNVGTCTISVSWDGVVQTKEIDVKPNKPEVQFEIKEDNTIILGWDEVKGAEYYIVKSSGMSDVRIPLNGSGRYSFTDTRYKNTSPSGYVEYHVYVCTLAGDTYAFKTVYFGKRYPVTYHMVSGAVNSPKNPTVIVEGNSYILYEPRAIGYTFGGWYSSPDYAQKMTGIFLKKSAVDVYGKFSPKNYKIRLHNNWQESRVTSVQSATYDVAKKLYTISELGWNTPGLTFAGWNTKPDGSGISYSDGQTVKNLFNEEFDEGAEFDLYAQWKAAKYRITFDENGGNALSVSEKTIEVFYGDRYENLPLPTKNGYTFQGWYTARSGGIRVDSSLAVLSSHTLYAHWKAGQYNVTFSVNGGDELPIDKKVKSITFDDVYGELPIPTRVGYEFAGWYTEIECINKIESTSIVAIAGKHKLFAGWRVITCNVSFDVNGGNELSADKRVKSVSYGDTYDTLPEPERRGYSFDGWYTDATDGTRVKASTPVTVTSDQTLYAHWTAILHDVIIDFNDERPTPVIHYSVLDTYSLAEMLTYDGKSLRELIGPAYNYATFYIAESIYDKTTPITADVSLKIYWSAIPAMRIPSASIETASVIDNGSILCLTADAGARIYYTTDGSAPTEGSTLYDGPVALTYERGELQPDESSVITVKTVAVMDGYKNSDVGVYTYTLRPKQGDVTTQDLEKAGYTKETIPGRMWMVTDSESYEYTGTAIVPSVHVYYGNRLLTENTDYKVSVKNNKKVTTTKAPATVTVTGKGSFAGSIKKNFAITPKGIGSAAVSAAPVEYSGRAQTPKFTVYDAEGIRMYEKTDYKVKYLGEVCDALSATAVTETGINYKNTASAFAEGEYVYEITGLGNYGGKTYGTFVISGARLLSKAKVTLPAYTYTYTGEEITPEPVVILNGETLTKDVDYTVTYASNVSIGTGKVIITSAGSDFINGSCYGKTEKSFSITGTSLSKAKITNNTVPVSGNLPAIVYGNPNLVQRDEHGQDVYGAGGCCYIPDMSGIELSINGSPLTEGTDYTVSYKNNDRIGTATVVFNGKGGYSGSIKRSYKIAAPGLGDGIIELGNGSPLVVKYEVGGARPTPEVSFTYNYGTAEMPLNVTKPLTYGTDYTLSYSKNTSVSDIAVIKITGRGNYKGSVSKTFSIVGSDLSGVSMEAGDVIYRNSKTFYKSVPVLKTSRGEKLKANRDYTRIEYTYAMATSFVNASGTEVKRSEGSAVEAGDRPGPGTVLRVTVSGKGNYVGADPENPDKISATYRIVSKSIAKAGVKIKDQKYADKPVIPAKEDIAVKIGKTYLNSSDYEIIGISNNMRPGYAKVTIRGTGMYGGTKTVRFKIVK